MVSRLPRLLLLLAAFDASAVSPKRVLILDPFGRNVAPFTTAVSSFRTTLARELGEPVDFCELPLELTRFSGPEGEPSLVTFLEGRLKEQPVDLVVPVGGAGFQFARDTGSAFFKTLQSWCLPQSRRWYPRIFENQRYSCMPKGESADNGGRYFATPAPDHQHRGDVRRLRAGTVLDGAVPARVPGLHEPGGVHLGERLNAGTNSETLRRAAAALVHLARIVCGGCRRSALRKERSLAAVARGRQCASVETRAALLEN